MCCLSKMVEGSVRFRLADFVFRDWAVLLDLCGLSVEYCTAKSFPMCSDWCCVLKVRLLGTEVCPFLRFCLQIENLKSFQGDKDKMANADRFYSFLLVVPWYRHCSPTLLSVKQSVTPDCLLFSGFPSSSVIS